MITVFFDLDGVLADFVGGALKAHNRTDVNPANVTWGLEAQLGIAPEAFWAPFGYEFWANLDICPDGFKLLESALLCVGSEQIGLLTSPCDTAGCVDGKRAWVMRHLPDFRRRLFVGSAKELFAGPTKVLVDDHDANVTRFQAAGGLTVQPPRPWNSRKEHCFPGTAEFTKQVAQELHDTILRAGNGLCQN